MPLFRKRPVTVEAIQFTAETCAEVCAFIGIEHHDVGRCGLDSPLSIHTLEGVMVAAPGDWIIRGVQCEYYPCKPDIFEATYEPASIDGAPAAPAPLERPFGERAADAFAEWRALPENHDTTRVSSLSSFIAGARWAHGAPANAERED